MLRSKQPRGFTLMEVLVASALISVVMAMALQAFTGMNRISSQANAKTVAGSEASKGVHAIVALLRRANIIFFTGRPITSLEPGTALAPGPDLTRTGNAVNVDLTGDTTRDPQTARVPDELGGDGVNGGPQIRYNFTDPTERVYSDAGGPNAALNTGTPPRRGKFRFWDAGAAVSVTNTMTGAQRLRSNEPAAAAAPANQPYDQFYSSPLMYLAEANFAKDNAGGGTDGAVEGMYLPLSWTFHVVYLAPMDVSGVFTRNEPAPGWVATNRRSDLGPGGWRRSTIPFELRVLTIPYVEADKDGNLLTAQNIVPGASHVMGAPYDYLPNQVNYDPVPLPFIGDLDNWRATGKFYPGTAIRPSGPRVNGALHTNYNNIGNDPPNQAVFNQPRLVDPATGARAVARDVVIARYVDPDSVHGTCVRLLNTIRTQVDPPPAAMGPYRQYLNAYLGEYLYNHYAPFQGSGWVVENGPGIPQRALVSVATRYRSDSNTAFQFGSETLEVDLENLVRYQSISRTSR